MKIRKLELWSDRLDELERFYRESLDLPVERNHGQLEVRVGSTRMCWLDSKSSKVEDGTSPTYHIAFDIPYSQVDEASELLAQKLELLPIDSQLRIAEFTNWKARSFYFLDPAGNVLECIGRKEITEEAGENFGERSWLRVSEIGVVTHDVTGVCDALLSEGITFFEKQPPMENFAALGNDEGLFIVVKDQRPWYPTRLPASIAAGKVWIEQDGRLLLYRLGQKPGFDQLTGL